jgi:cytochrome P450
MTANAADIESRFILDLPEAEVIGAGPEFLARLRRDMPIAYIPSMSVWLITKADDAAYTIRNPDLFWAFVPEHTTEPILGSVFISGDISPEQYTRIRKGGDAALNPKAMKRTVPEAVIPAIEAQLDRLKGRMKFDLLDDMFGPVNFDAMKYILGIPHIPNETMMRWYEGIHECIENLSADPQKMARGRQLSAEIDEVFIPIVAQKDAAPDGSLIAHMLAFAEGDTLDARRQFIMGHIKTLLLAGVQEGAHACVNAVIGLLSSPNDMERFKAEPDKFADLLTEETVRWMPPVAAIHRRTTQVVEIRGARIPAQHDLLISLASASRDEEKWGDDAELFVLDRFSRDRANRQPQIGFGHMPRFCQGAPFIRNFVHQGLSRLFKRFPTLRPDPDYEWRVPSGLLSNYCHMRCVVD